MYAREGVDCTLAAAGDAIITRKLSTCTEKRLEAALDPVRSADVSVVNLEVLLHDFEGYPAAINGGTYMRAPPAVADELVWAGFDLFAAATNHIGDYSHGGMEATMRALEARDLPYAGLGRNLAEARQPTYVDTSAGRVALVAACSSITTGTVAGHQRPDMKGRPGLAPMRLETTYRMAEGDLERLRDLSEALGLEAAKHYRERLGFTAPGRDDAFTFLNVDGDRHLSAVADAEGEYAVERRVNQPDLEAYTRQIASAARQADWVIASLHAHEGAGALHNDHGIPGFLERVARGAIDAGADAFVGHGPHLLRGIEIYEGAPIFYSLGNFLMQNETVQRLPHEQYHEYELGDDALPPDLFDARVFDDDEPIGFLADEGFWESVVPTCEFTDGTLDRVELHPVELGYDAPRSQRGRPLRAVDATAERIVTEIAELSEPYGTDIGFDADRELGVIET